MDDCTRLRIQFDTVFETTERGRIVRANDPDHSAGPLFWLAGSKDGNVSGIRADIPSEIAAEILALAAGEPAFVPPNDAPQHLERYLSLLTRDGVAPRYTPGVIYDVPKDLPAPSDVATVDSDSAEGRDLIAALDANGMPDGLHEMGFHDTSEFWPPWCAALFYGLPVAVCFAARLSGAGAEVGVATAKNFRGRGFAAAATAGWSRMKSLQSRALFYATDRTNQSSMRVAARLGLRLIGNRMTVS